VKVSYPLRVYYDRQCPLCAAEMHALKSHDRDSRLDLVDCSEPGFADEWTAGANLGRDQLMAFIHARDAAGRWLRGVEVFEAAYDAAGVDAFARLWAHPWLRPTWDRLYPWVARHRMALSRLGINRLFGRLVAHAARRAELRRAACAQGLCRRR
jgi:predicted DCC family thiol-disulfide oxidoreductase YuxK